MIPSNSKCREFMADVSLTIFLMDKGVVGLFRENKIECPRAFGRGAASRNETRHRAVSDGRLNGTTLVTLEIEVKHRRRKSDKEEVPGGTVDNSLLSW